MSKQAHETTSTEIEKALLVGVFTNTLIKDQQNQMDELEGLVTNLGAKVIDKVIQYRKKIDVKYFIGKGKLKSIYESALENKCKYVIINNDI